MPGLRGDKVQRRLRRLDPSVRIVFVSGHRNPDVEQALLDEGALAFMGKPLGSAALLGAIQDALAAPIGAVGTA